MSWFPFKLAGIEAELQTSKQELRDINNMYVEAEESRQRHVVRHAIIALCSVRDTWYAKMMLLLGWVTVFGRVYHHGV